MENASASEQENELLIITISRAKQESSLSITWLKKSTQQDFFPILLVLLRC